MSSEFPDFTTDFDYGTNGTTTTTEEPEVTSHTTSDLPQGTTIHTNSDKNLKKVGLAAGLSVGLLLLIIIIIIIVVVCCRRSSRKPRIMKKLTTTKIKIRAKKQAGDGAVEGQANPAIELGDEKPAVILPGEPFPNLANSSKSQRNNYTDTELGVATSPGLFLATEASPSDQVRVNVTDPSIDTDHIYGNEELKPHSNFVPPPTSENDENDDEHTYGNVKPASSSNSLEDLPDMPAPPPPTQVHSQSVMNLNKHISSTHPLPPAVPFTSMPNLNAEVPLESPPPCPEGSGKNYYNIKPSSSPAGYVNQPQHTDSDQEDYQYVATPAKPAPNRHCNVKPTEDNVYADMTGPQKRKDPVYANFKVKP